MGERTVADLVVAARDGDQGAWDELVARFSRFVWSIVRSYDLRGNTAEDAYQTVWLKLVEHLDRLREPAAVGGWLATTARHECLRLIRHQGRTYPVDEIDLRDEADDDPGPDAGVLTEERDRALWQAVEELGGRCRQLLRVLMSDPPPSYQEVSGALDMPIGSIGPTRQRCLSQLLEILEGRGITAAAWAS